MDFWMRHASMESAQNDFFSCGACGMMWTVPKPTPASKPTSV
jgi:hypothetical protein